MFGPVLRGVETAGGFSGFESLIEPDHSLLRACREDRRELDRIQVAGVLDADLKAAARLTPMTRGNSLRLIGCYPLDTVDEPALRVVVLGSSRDHAEIIRSRIVSVHETTVA